MSTAEAPSLICDEVPAVCRPSGSTVFSAGEALERGVAQALVGVDDAGLAGRRAVLVRAPAPSMAAISRLNRPSSTATRAFCCEARPNASRSARLRPRLLGDPVGGLELVGHVDRPVGRTRVAGAGGHVGAERDAGHRLDAGGDPDLDACRRVIMSLTRWAACWPEPHCASTMVPPVCCARPGVQPGAAHHAVGLLAGLGDAAGDDLVDEVGVEPGAGERPRSWRGRSGRRGARRPASPCACRGECGRRR